MNAPCDISSLLQLYFSLYYNLHLQCISIEEGCRWSKSFSAMHIYSTHLFNCDDANISLIIVVHLSFLLVLIWARMLTRILHSISKKLLMLFSMVTYWKSFLLKYAFDESITDFWLSTVSLTELVLHTSDTLTVLSWWYLPKTSSSFLIEILANRLHTVLWMILRKRPWNISVLTWGRHAVISRNR